MVLDGAPAATGNVGAGNRVGQILFDVGLMITADETRGLGDRTWKIDGELQFFNWVGEACQQRQFQLQPAIDRRCAGFGSLSGLGGFGSQSVDCGMDGETHRKGIVAGHITDDAGKTHQTGRAGLFRQHRLAV